MATKRRIRQAAAPLVAWTSRNGLTMLRIALAVVFIWFGALKLFGASPADGLVRETVFWFDPSWFIPLLGVWEVCIGVCFLFPRLVRIGIWLIIPQMLGTFLPLFILSNAAFRGGNPLLPTLEGQYIIKNLVLLSAAIVIASSTGKKSRERRGR